MLGHMLQFKKLNALPAILLSRHTIEITKCMDGKNSIMMKR